MNAATIKRQVTIAGLVSQIQQRAQTAKSGSVCLVPSASDAGKVYRVEIDENYNPISCDCRGGRHNCLHKQAAALFFSPSLARLLESPLYEFRRAGNLVKARLAQFSKAEKSALVEAQAAANKAAAEQAARRAAYNNLFDPNGIDAAMYA